MNREDIRSEIARILTRPVDSIDDASALAELAADSFQLVELIVELQEITGARIVQEDLRTTRTVGELVDLLASGDSAMGPLVM